MTGGHRLAGWHTGLGVYLFCEHVGVGGGGGEGHDGMDVVFSCGQTGGVERLPEPLFDEGSAADVELRR